jgi:hypothetical protein
MGNKKVPDEVVTAMELAKAAKWPVSNRNKMIHIIAPDGTNITIGHNPNDESMKVFRSNCRKYNLIGQGPARTREEVEQLFKEAEATGLAEADRLNAQRKAYEAEQRAKQQQIEAARQKAEAATQQGLTQEMSMISKSPQFPTFDSALLGTKDNSKFLLADGTYYCIECWSQNRKETFKAPQGLAAHRGVRHQMYPGASPILTQETSRVLLPDDINTAFDMLRSAVGEALGHGADPQALAAKEADLAELRGKLEAATKQADADRKDADKKFLEAQTSFDKRLTDASNELKEKHEAEVKTLMAEFQKVLKQIQSSAETLSPIQAIAKIDGIVRNFAG